MAFGKDPNDMNKVKAYGGQRIGGQRQILDRNRGSGRSGAPYFVNQYKPVAEEGADPDLIRLIRGEYELDVAVGRGPTATTEKRTFFFYPCMEHLFMTAPNQPRGYLCSAGPFRDNKQKAEPCAGCDAFWANKSNKSSPHSRSELSVFTVLHFANYAKVPQVDKQGNIRMNESTNEPYYEWIRVFPHEVRKYEKYEMRNWSLKHWPLKFGAFNTITAYDDEVAKSCRSCGNQYCISTVVWLCQNCGTDLIDPNTTNATPAEVAKLCQGMLCKSCGHNGPLNELISCNTCSNPQRADIFDVDLRVKRTPGANDRLELRMMGFVGPRPLDATYTTPVEEGKHPIAHPLDLPRIYTPTPLEQQEALIGSGARPSGRTPVPGPQSFSQPWTQGGGDKGGSGPNYG